MNKLIRVAPIASVLLALSGCQSVVAPNSPTSAKQVNVQRSYLEEEAAGATSKTPVNTENATQEGGFEYLNRLADRKQNLKLEIDLSAQFSGTDKYQVSVDALPLNDFIHYALGELLDVSYLIEPSVKAKTTPVTLELKTEVGAKRLFQLIQEVLAQNNIDIVLNDGVFYVYPFEKSGSKSERAFGFGRTAASVPNVSSDIIQLVPIKYGVSTGLRNSVAGLVDAQIAIDPAQGMMTVIGKREQIIRALELLALIDSPALSNKAIALMSFTYIDSQTFIEKVSEILENEGVPVNSGARSSASIQFVPIEHLGKVVVFATADEIIDRVEYWAKQLDKPATGSEQSFYIYHPKYARASDLGQSLAPLLGGNNFATNSGNNARSETRASTSSNTSSSATQSNRTRSGGAGSSAESGSFAVESDGIKMVVDQRANALIFYSTGQYYQELQPILKQLDIMPKQVMMEVVIAEVKLTGGFSKGVQYALKSGDSTTTTEEFNFSSKDGFNYSIVGMPGSIKVNLNQSNGLVNVLSRPTLLVRDGVAANISVGDDIPTKGSTTIDPLGNTDRETSTIQYRKTGVNLNVTPTINAQGTVIMTIEQSISSVNNEAAGISGTPAIFERSLSTEVVAGDGQTVLLGGLISQNNSKGATSVPLLGSLPMLGHLFRTDESSTDKTELVVLVTPKIINNRDDWRKVEQSFKKGLENLVF
ncbi:secretin N-terminal domain-containing protein [Pseudoalteromonas peptidolytica]|uniref:General secretion pathway protein D n=1 Tax=Pseudoalteromonas peptidolytica F12-50-A1 TaxID=1315280 RepID=A0A8I0T5I4_9GAMM|nr:secretin N-terminal domain-containing protein [Pseudoalteromonas peptidolytica]MBE0347283.1 general secretion pathway protein D [Pseudoalteromonas peptidolytica F12-50-A1]NLR13920.1 type II secretory pathway protein [Pseudoalteromonas peptidolytica]GEK08876.1 type II secretion system protein GspD [Pseudoalteromonas peptidolytica]